MPGHVEVGRRSRLRSGRLLVHARDKAGNFRLETSELLRRPIAQEPFVAGLWR